MKIAIMQPYFLPYIGYFQLVGAVDRFVVYDNVKYTKKGWINRNRFLLNGRDELFSLPLKKGSDNLDVRDRWLAPAFDRRKLLNRLTQAYRCAPCFDAVMPLVRRIVERDEQNLFGFILASLKDVCAYLGMATPLVVSSSLEVDHSLQGQDRVLAICRHLGAATYVNAIGGRELYSRELFAAQGIDLRFLRSRPFGYPQFGQPFIPWLSIIDVLMFNSADRVASAVRTGYELE